MKNQGKKAPLLQGPERRAYLIACISATPYNLTAKTLARECGCCEKTIYEDLKDKDLKAAIKAAVLDQVGSIGISKAWARVVAAMDGKNQYNALRAAMYILDKTIFAERSPLDEEDEAEQWQKFLDRLDSPDPDEPGKQYTTLKDIPLDLEDN